MRSSLLRRASTAPVVAALAASLWAVAAPAAAPTTAAATTAAAAPAAGTCTVTDATVTWGVKESFRSYISGSIAHGSWEPFGAVTYATPAFTWTGGAGAVDPETGAGSISFAGGIRFTGHDGLLDTTIQNATLDLAPGAGRLLVDLSGVSMDDALAGDNTVTTSTQVPLVSVDLAGLALTANGDTISVETRDAATAITAEGYEAFGNYETGTAFDPLTLTATATCAAPAATPDPATPDPAETTVDPSGADATVAGAQDAERSSGTGPSGALIAVVVSSIAGAAAATVAGVAAARAARRRRDAAAPNATPGTAPDATPDGTPGATLGDTPAR